MRRTWSGRRTLVVAIVAVALPALAGCSSASGGGDGASADAAIEGRPATFEVTSSVEQLLVSGAEPGSEITVVDADGDVVAQGTVDDQGLLIAREITPGDGYRVVAGDGDDREVSEPVAVEAVDDVPDDSFYADQQITEGYQYLETRDGTLLAVDVVLPGPPEDGPYPTVVEYSGYDPANPDGQQPSKLIAAQLGYAAVGVNMRGTGCSGGSFLFFEPAQWTDGYDAIEVIAAQPWVRDHRVGMVGLSYPGISQLFVAQTQPPSLAAIAPLSVIDDTYRATLYPGGILNNGFATSWAKERQEQAEPGGQEWAQARIDDGDDVCEQNQLWRSQNPQVTDLIDENEFVPTDAGSYVARLAPSEWVDRIEVPVFLAGAWQDEQTGGHFPAMLDRFTGSPLTRFTMTNGGHTDSLDPAVMARWIEFLALYVAREVPSTPDEFRGLVPLLGDTIFETAIELPPDRFGPDVTYDEALATFESDPTVRILFENGTGGEPGAPVPGFEAGFDAWPIPETEATSWYLDASGRLSESEPAAEGVDEYDYDTSRAQQGTLGDDENPWAALPPWTWEAPPEGSAVSYVSEPLDETLVMAGHGRVDLYVGASAPDVDLQVTLSEVRPDGKEVYVQNGWLRASHRALDEERSSELRPYHTHLEADAEPLPADGSPAEVNVELFPFAHVFRAGSRLRLVVDTPGGTRPEWRFDVIEPDADTQVRVSRGGATPSRITLPVIPGVDVPTPLPPCPSLRGQPCRDDTP